MLGGDLQLVGLEANVLAQIEPPGEGQIAIGVIGFQNGSRRCDGGGGRR